MSVASDIVERAIEAARAKRREQDDAIGDGYYEHFPPTAEEREEIISVFAAVLREGAPDPSWRRARSVGWVRTLRTRRTSRRPRS